MKILRCKNSLTAILTSGRIIQTGNCTDEIFEKIKKFKEEDNEFEIINLLIPENADDAHCRMLYLRTINKVQDSKILEIKTTEDKQSIYWLEVSPLSMPPELAEKVLEAEKNNDENLLDTYRNFWTLTSLNPNPEIRKNLFKFLIKWGMVISKSGLFVGYRNVEIKVIREPFETSIFTDRYSRTTTVQIGHITSIPIEECNQDSSVECSRGLHIGGESWLMRNYYGNVGLVCLVNPMDVVAVPWCNADYGKLRTCAYLPISIAKYDNKGAIIPYTDKDGFESIYVKKILYDGVINPEEFPEYSIRVVDEEHKTVSDKILKLARKFIQETN